MRKAAARLATGRHSGLMVPLFSIPSAASWGVGEIPDLVPLSRWMQKAGLHFVQLLPVNEMEEGQSSPYSALSALAIDPIFIALRDVDEFDEIGGEASLDSAARVRLECVRGAEAVEYGGVRALKSDALRRSFAHFLARHWHSGSSRAAGLRQFKEREAWWLNDYALFRALHEEHDGRFWDEWPEPLRDRAPAALEAARARLEQQILYFEYVQWLADEQWQRARTECGHTAILGDFPFMVSGHSADVWLRQHEFRIDASVGVPPDAFSETGQDWGLPVYRWDVIEKGDYQWLRDRTRRSGELYDGFRLDHLVGFFRTFVRERDGRKYFVPATQAEQRAQGERLLELFAAEGSRILAEDLGTVPDFVRESMAHLGIPGCKVFRWEREWDVDGRPFRDPVSYPAVSVATTGTHDTETLAEWWENAEDEERERIAEIPSLRDRRFTVEAAFSAETRDTLLDVLLGARSNLAILPMQDVFGWRARINTPASVNAQNWTWRLPWPIERMTAPGEPLERARFLRALADKHGRV